MSVGVSMGCMSFVCACVVYSRASSVCICGGKGVRQFKNLGSGVREASTGVLPHHIAVHPTQIIELSPPVSLSFKKTYHLLSLDLVRIR